MTTTAAAVRNVENLEVSLSETLNCRIVSAVDGCAICRSEDLEENMIVYVKLTDGKVGRFLLHGKDVAVV